MLKRVEIFVGDHRMIDRVNDQYVMDCEHF